jgi:hypothetical protein
MVTGVALADKGHHLNSHRHPWSYTAQWPFRKPSICIIRWLSTVGLYISTAAAH